MLHLLLTFWVFFVQLPSHGPSTNGSKACTPTELAKSIPTWRMTWGLKQKHADLFFCEKCIYLEQFEGLYKYIYIKGISDSTSNYAGGRCYWKATFSKYISPGFLFKKGGGPFRSQPFLDWNSFNVAMGQIDLYLLWMNQPTTNMNNTHLCLDPSECPWIRKVSKSSRCVLGIVSFGKRTSMYYTYRLLTIHKVPILANLQQLQNHNI